MTPRRKIAQPRIVQPGSGRWGRGRLPALFFLIALVACWFAYEYGRTGLWFNSMAADSRVVVLERRVDGLRQQVARLESERQRLREEVAVLKRASQIDREAVRAAGEEMKNIQEGRLRMEEELIFLRGIIANKVDKKSLRIRDFKLQPTQGPRVFKYSFTVSQIVSGKRGVRGDVLIRVSGEQAGKKKRLELAALTAEKRKSLKLDLRHFQRFEGLLRLPEGFVASDMTINIKPDKRGLPRLNETFKWSVEE